MTKKKDTLESFGRLLDIMDKLREECPWDKKQTFESIRPLTIEETYELADSILNGEMHEVKKELGDLLLHIVFYAKIGSESGDFDIKDIIDSLNEKLIYRHPHVFSGKSANNATEVSENWEQLKLKEKGRNKTVLGGIPKSLPSLVKAIRIQGKVRAVGFDWDEKEQIWDKVKEEFEELQHEIIANNIEKTEKEFGDLLFSVINAARLYGVNPDNALEKTNLKFMKRFNYLEQKTIAKGLSLKDMDLDEMNVIWEEAKLFDEENNT